jgi:hypothetical protein
MQQQEGSLRRRRNMAVQRQRHFQAQSSMQSATAVEQHLRAGLTGSAAGVGRSMLQESRDGPQHGPEQHWLLEAGYQPLTARQPLFARKFSAEVQGELLPLALSCAGLGLGGGCA